MIKSVIPDSNISKNHFILATDIFDEKENFIHKSYNIIDAYVWTLPDRDQD